MHTVLDGLASHTRAYFCFMPSVPRICFWCTETQNKAVTEDNCIDIQVYVPLHMSVSKWGLWLWASHIVTPTWRTAQAETSWLCFSKCHTLPRNANSLWLPHCTMFPSSPFTWSCVSVNHAHLLSHWTCIAYSMLFKSLFLLTWLSCISLLLHLLLFLFQVFWLQSLSCVLLCFLCLLCVTHT